MIIRPDRRGIRYILRKPQATALALPDRKLLAGNSMIDGTEYGFYFVRITGRTESIMYEGHNNFCALSGPHVELPIELIDSP